MELIKLAGEGITAMPHLLLYPIVEVPHIDFHALRSTCRCAMSSGAVLSWCMWLTVSAGDCGIRCLRRVDCRRRLHCLHGRHRAGN